MRISDWSSDVCSSDLTLAEGCQSVCEEWLGFVQRSLKGNMEGVSALMACRTPQDLAAKQPDILKSRMEDLMSSAARASELSAKATSDAIHGIGHRAGQTPPATRTSVGSGKRGAVRGKIGG